MDGLLSISGKKMIRNSNFINLVFAGVLLIAPWAVTATEKVTIQLKWSPQAQFAGYYVAQAKGYYKDAGLDVTIKPGGADIKTVQVIASNGADVIVNWLPGALAAREEGIPLVNIAQIFNKSGLMLTCKRSNGVNSPKDFKGKTMGVWLGGNEHPFLNWMAKLGYKPDTDIKILKQGHDLDLLTKNQADCISTMIYKEYWELIDAGLKESDLINFSYDKEGVGSLEDGLYVLESKLKDPAFVSKMGKFLKASLKGWSDAVKDPDGTAKIMVAADRSGHTSEKIQKRAMENVATLITNAGTPKMGYLEPKDFERTVKILISNQATPFIKKDPGTSAYTYVVWEAASK